LKWQKEAKKKWGQAENVPLLFFNIGEKILLTSCLILPKIPYVGGIIVEK
jgi:hypothetical protein